MNPELEEKLFQDFPLLYDRNCEMRFGFECDDGWYDLIRELSEKLYPLIKQKKPNVFEYVCTASQVKEKYGTLRFYMNCCTTTMSEIIDEYEEMSSTICEVCGAEGSIDYNQKWLKSTCEEHRSQ